jgi:cell division initiation protein
MLSIDDIINISFRKASIGGYRTEDVEAFIDDVQASYDQLLKENADLLRKLEILAKKVEEYREEEESIRTTLMNAQKLADASVREAKHKAEVILKDATAKADKILDNAQKEVSDQQSMMQNLQNEVSTFRSRLLDIYKEHLRLINALPAEEPQEPVDDTLQETVSEPEEEESKVEEVDAREASKAYYDQLIQQVTQETVSTEPEPIAEMIDTNDQVQASTEDQVTSSAKFGTLKFGEDYDLSNDDDESPIGMFKRRK